MPVEDNLWSFDVDPGFIAAWPNESLMGSN